MYLLLVYYAIEDSIHSAIAIGYILHVCADR